MANGIIIDSKTGEETIEEFEPTEITEEEIKQERIQEIYLELKELDKTIDRATEDLYVLASITPYAGITEIINQKEKLREKLAELEAE